jgi:hypothetical protein
VLGRPDAESGRRGVTRELRALLAVALIFTLGFVGYRVLFAEGLADRFRIVTVAGEVQHVRAGGAAAPAREGTVLHEGDRIVSGNGASAVLGLGDDTRISVDATTSVQVVGVNDEGVQLELEGGRVRATVRPGGGRVGVRGGGRTVAADDADFTVVRDAAGTFAATSTRGTLAVDGVDGVTELRAGAEVIAPLGGTPLRAPASDTLFLQVAWPATPRTRDDTAEVSGTTQPGATVSVTGGARPVTVSAGPDGTFRVTVPLGEGRNALSLRATNALGREAEIARAEIERDSTAPSVGVSLDF